jgi:hypothetical protein
MKTRALGNCFARWACPNEFLAAEPLTHRPDLAGIAIRQLPWQRGLIISFCEGHAPALPPLHEVHQDAMFD